MSDTKAKKVAPVVVEGFEINGQSVSFARLQEFTLTLLERLRTHRKQRNWLTLERDKLRTVLENTRHETRLADDALLNKDRELEAAQQRFREELREVDQHRKFLEYDLGKSLEQVTVREAEALVKTRDKNMLEELELLREKRQLKEELAKETLRYNEEISSLKNKHLDEITKLQQECFEFQVEKENEFKKYFNQSIEQLNLKHEMEMSELEERKNTHLNELKKIHKLRTDETKTFFNSVTAENLAVIANLRENLNSIKVNKVDLAAKVKFLKDDNERLRGPLETSKANVKNLKRQVVNYEKDLLSLKNNKWMLRKTLDQVKKIKEENVLAVSKLNSYEVEGCVENVEFYSFHTLRDLKTSVIHKRERLEGYISYLLDELKRKQKIIKDLTSDVEVSKSLAEMNFETWSPKQLSYELAIVCKAHNELLRTLQGKLEEFCISGVELGFKPMAMKYIGEIPAALVSNQLS